MTEETTPVDAAPIDGAPPVTAPDASPTEATNLTLEQEEELLEDTEFPEEEFDLPEQTPEDLGETDEEVSS